MRFRYTYRKKSENLKSEPTNLNYLVVNTRRNEKTLETVIFTYKSIHTYPSLRFQDLRSCDRMEVQKIKKEKNKIHKL